MTSDSPWPPPRFSWIEPSRLAAMAMPQAAEELHWLRQQGIELLISLTEFPPPRQWVNESGLMLVHVPIPDMTAPRPAELSKIVETIRKAHASGLGVAVHCAAGLGRTGTVLAAYLTAQGMSAAAAIAHVRQLRPGSIETRDQEEAVFLFAARPVGDGATNPSNDPPSVSSEGPTDL